MSDAVILATSRSPIGKATKGSLSDERPDDMLAQVLNCVMAKIPELRPCDLSDLIAGCGSPGGEQGFNIARVAAVLNGWDQLPALTINRYCASGLEAVRLAAHAVQADEGSVFLAGGVESCSSYAKGEADSIPGTMNPAFDQARRRTATRAEGEAPAWTDPRAGGDLPDVYIDMGQTAENVAEHMGVSRVEMDEFALRSQRLTATAIENGFWAANIDPYQARDGEVVTTDDSPRPNSELSVLESLPPVFRPDGLVTAGNSCPLSDGAAAAIVASNQKSQQLGVEPIARIVTSSVSALSPEIMGPGPVEATRIALSRAGMTVGDIDQFEINEAFAAQVIPSYLSLGIPVDKLNVNGGEIAMGHPFGSTGVRMLSTLIQSLQWHDQSLGLMTMCVGGGQGAAMVIERMK